MSKSDYNKGDGKVVESWARGVQWELTRMIYPDYLGRERRTNDYTLVVADLIDNSYTEKTNYGFGYYSSDGLKDQVSGYTIRQIEDALIGQRTWNSWRDNIIKKHANPTEKYLNKLFLNYE